MGRWWRWIGLAGVGLCLFLCCSSLFIVNTRWVSREGGCVVQRECCARAVGMLLAAAGGCDLLVRKQPRKGSKEERKGREKLGERSRVLALARDRQMGWWNRAEKLQGALLCVWVWVVGRVQEMLCC
ncbi:hypothetical protein DFP73DRAFT_556757 [Morchella snyderi]|nr:hypothetical protein DFP73DRAFT_556757 [Morchella snyderi]